MTFSQQAAGVAERSGMSLQHGVRPCKAAAHSWRPVFTRNREGREAGDRGMRPQNRLQREETSLHGEDGRMGHCPALSQKKKKIRCVSIRCI